MNIRFSSASLDSKWPTTNTTRIAWWNLRLWLCPCRLHRDLRAIARGLLKISQKK